jgi:prevent-host-death family protein
MQHNTADIIPLTEFKAKSAKIVKELRESRRPLVLTQNGRAALVVMSPQAFDRIKYEEYVRAKIAEGLAAAERGEVIEDDEMWARMEEHMAQFEEARK